MHDFVHDHKCDQANHPTSYRVFGAFMRTMHAHRSLMSGALGDMGSHPGQSFCMREIAHHEGITQKELAEILQVTPPTVSVMLQKLEKAGLIERRADERDQRFMRLYVTEAGKEHHVKAHERIGRAIAMAISPMSEADQLELERLLTQLHDNMIAAMEADNGKDDD